MWVGKTQAFTCQLADGSVRGREGVHQLGCPGEPRWLGVGQESLVAFGEAEASARGSKF